MSPNIGGSKPGETLRNWSAIPNGPAGSGNAVRWETAARTSPPGRVGFHAHPQGVFSNEKTTLNGKDHEPISTWTNYFLFVALAKVGDFSRYHLTLFSNEHQNPLRRGHLMYMHTRHHHLRFCEWPWIHKMTLFPAVHRTDLSWVPGTCQSRWHQRTSQNLEHDNGRDVYSLVTEKREFAKHRTFLKHEKKTRKKKL